MDHVTNDNMCNSMRHKLGHYEDLLKSIKNRKLKWYGHVTRVNSLSTPIQQGSAKGGRRRGTQRNKWSDNMTEWDQDKFLIGTGIGT